MTTIKQAGFAHVGLIAAIIAVVGVLGLVGFRAYQSLNSQDQLSNSQELADEAVLPASLDDILSFEQVKELAVQSTDASITDFELQSDDDTLVYKVQLSTGTTVVIDARTGAVISTTDGATHPREDSADALPAHFTVATSFEQARATAQATFPTSRITKIALDVENGVVVISVRFADKARVDVSAATGEVVRTKEPRTADDASTTNTPADPDTPVTNQPTSGADTPSGDSGSRSGSNSGSGDGSDDTEEDRSGSNSGSDSSNSGSDSDDIRVEGVLQSANGSYTVTQDGVTYTISSSHNLSALVGATVRAEGVLTAGNVIKADKVEAR